MECTYINEINHFFLVEIMCELMKSQSKRGIQLINEITGYFLSPWGRKYSGFSNSVKAYEEKISQSHLEEWRIPGKE